MKPLTKILMLVICLGCGCSSNSADRTTLCHGERINTTVREQHKKNSKEIVVLQEGNSLVLEIKASLLFLRGSARLHPKKHLLLEEVKRLIGNYRPGKVVVGIVGNLVVGDELMDDYYRDRIQAVIDHLWHAEKSGYFIRSDRLAYDSSKPETIRIELLDFYA